uniref:Myozenin-3 n=1 Tax=Geotrypetes seraphini TaxID=260995 RepID=A0A6P8PHZ6_GEOSA|nr:myozenin-3 [Geotrypetes seraphini]XP_033783490.1 myozenin-3 [Geotrypetes seraphini]
MIPVATSDLTNVQKSGIWTIDTEDTGQDPQLFLGKKVSTPQDLMIEELNLRNNKASRMFLERQKRVQRFILEHPTNTTAGGRHMSQSARDAAGHNTFRTASVGIGGAEGNANYHTERFKSPTGKGGAPEALTRSSKVLQMKDLNPNAIAPGYSRPLREVPSEKFNVTIIPKAYRSPWHDALGNKENRIVNVRMDIPHPLTHQDYRSFNRTPLPFGGLIIGERTITMPAYEEFQDHTDTTSNLEFMCRRPSFNRAPRGWKIRIIPESCDL